MVCTIYMWRIIKLTAGCGIKPAVILTNSLPGVALIQSDIMI